MRYPYDEQNSHATADELSPAEEPMCPAEYMPEVETHKVGGENPTVTEIPTEDKHHGTTPSSDVGRRRQPAAFLSTTAVVCVTATAVILPTALTSAVDISLLGGSEDIGYSTYACVLMTEEEDLEAIIENRYGTAIATQALDAPGEHALSAEGLLPEEDYRLLVTDADGDEQFSHTFTTDAFLFLGEEADGIIPFTLHEDLSAELLSGQSPMDIGLMLYSSTRGDYSSNLIWDPSAESYLLTDGLYRDRYSIEMTLYPPDKEPVVYETHLEAGTLTPLSYDLTLGSITDGGPPTLLTLTYLIGDIDPYEAFSFEIVRAQEDPYFYLPIREEQIVLLGSDYSLSLNEPLAADDYILQMWGEYLGTDGYTRYNCILQIPFTIPPTE